MVLVMVQTRPEAKETNTIITFQHNGKNGYFVMEGVLVRIKNLEFLFPVSKVVWFGSKFARDLTPIVRTYL